MTQKGVSPFWFRSASQRLGACLALLSVSVSGAMANAAPVTLPPPDHGRFGLGFEFGDPTGLVAKYWRGPVAATDFGLSYSFTNFIVAYADDLYHFRHAFSQTDPFASRLVPYIGIGGELFVSTLRSRSSDSYFSKADGSSGSVGFGARVPLGMEWLAPRNPIGLFAELVPGLGFLPSFFGFFQAGLGARYYF